MAMRSRFWHFDKFMAESLLRQGRTDEAIAFAETCRSDGYEDHGVLCFCERALLEASRGAEAYGRYGLCTIRARWQKASTFDGKTAMSAVYSAPPACYRDESRLPVCRQAGVDDRGRRLRGSPEQGPQPQERPAVRPGPEAVGEGRPILRPTSATNRRLRVGDRLAIVRLCVAGREAAYERDDHSNKKQMNLNCICTEQELCESTSRHSFAISHWPVSCGFPRPPRATVRSRSSR